jgi:hypothetical protein
MHPRLSMVIEKAHVNNLMVLAFFGLGFFSKKVQTFRQLGIKIFYLNFCVTLYIQLATGGCY